MNSYIKVNIRSTLCLQNGDYYVKCRKIEEGFVLDHIKAGKSLSIYEHLQLDKLDCTVAIIKNARSGKWAKGYSESRM